MDQLCSKLKDFLGKSISSIPQIFSTVLSALKKYSSNPPEDLIHSLDGLSEENKDELFAIIKSLHIMFVEETDLLQNIKQSIFKTIFNRDHKIEIISTLTETALNALT